MDSIPQDSKMTSGSFALTGVPYQTHSYAPYVAIRVGRVHKGASADLINWNARIRVTYQLEVECLVNHSRFFNFKPVDHSYMTPVTNLMPSVQIYNFTREHGIILCCDPKSLIS